MLKKKILGAKVLDTNGYVQATRLITPAHYEGPLQLGDIYSARAVDQKIDEAASNGGVSEEKLTLKIDEAVANHKTDTTELESKINDILEQHKADIDKLEKSIADMKATGVDISGTYNKDNNKLSIVVTANGVSKTAEIDLSDIIDSNDLVDSDTDTVSREDGKSKINTNSMTEDELNTIISNDVKTSSELL